MQWWFKKFCNGDKSLEDKEHSSCPSEVDNNQLRAITEADRLTTHKKLLKNSMSTILWSFSIWMKLESWKSSISGCLTSRPEIFLKIIILKCHLLLLYAKTMSHFWIGLWHITKSGFYITTSNDHFSGWSEKKLQNTSQSQTCAKKGHDHCLMVCCQSDPLQLSESQWSHYIWEVCSANQWDALKTATPVTGTGQQKGTNSLWQCPSTRCTTNASKVEQIGL